jgi:hypothetical protein
MALVKRLVALLIIPVILISCGPRASSQQQVTSAPLPATLSPTPKPSSTRTPTPSITPTASITPSPTSVPICVLSTDTIGSDGWDCVSKNYGFSVHFPPTSSITRTIDNLVDVTLENSLTNPRVGRMIEIFSGESAETCFSPDARKIHIGENDFVLNKGFEPSGVVYAWKSYAIRKDIRNVCFFLVVGFQTWEQDDPMFPSEKDQGLSDIEAILSTFRWLEPLH